MNSSYTVHFEQDLQNALDNRSLLMFRDTHETRPSCSYNLRGQWVFDNDLLFIPYYSAATKFMLAGELSLMSYVEQGSKAAMTVRPHYQYETGTGPAWICGNIELPEAYTAQIAQMNRGGQAMSFYLEVNALVENRGKDTELLGLLNELNMGKLAGALHDFTIVGWSAVIQKITKCNAQLK
jgi:hypothetical protein